MDIERALVSKALQGDEIPNVIAHGIEFRHFSETPVGQECANVFQWASVYARQYGITPSADMVKQHFPDWYGESSADPISALMDEFMRNVRRRYFDSKVLELSRVPADRTSWDRLDEIMLDAARDLAAIVPSGGVARFTDMEKRIEQYEIERAEGTQPGILMNIPIIDDVTRGVRPGWLITNAGYSGRGKSMLTIWNLLAVFEQEKTALMISLEMSRQEVMERLDTMVTNFQHRILTQRDLPEEDVERWRRIAQVYKHAKQDIIVVDKMGGCTIDRVYAEINRYKPDVVAVDYVQRMTGTRASMSKWEGLEEITNELKTIAMETDTAIIMVSQDQRGSADQGSTETNMGGSVSIYQAADVYIGMYQDDQMRARNMMRVKMLKFRHGDRAESDMLWCPATMEFGPYDGQSAVFSKS
jgi:replicative DNA helicase